MKCNCEEGGKYELGKDLHHLQAQAQAGKQKAGKAPSRSRGSAKGRSLPARRRSGSALAIPLELQGDTFSDDEVLVPNELALRPDAVRPCNCYGDENLQGLQTE